MAACVDVPRWANFRQDTCAKYASTGLCAGGRVVDANASGSVFGYPERACCACGRSETMQRAEANDRVSLSIRSCCSRRTWSTASTRGSGASTTLHPALAAADGALAARVPRDGPQWARTTRRRTSAVRAEGARARRLAGDAHAADLPLVEPGRRARVPGDAQRRGSPDGVAGAPPAVLLVPRVARRLRAVHGHAYPNVRYFWRIEPDVVPAWAGTAPGGDAAAAARRLPTRCCRRRARRSTARGPHFGRTAQKLLAGIPEEAAVDVGASAATPQLRARNGGGG